MYFFKLKLYVYIVLNQPKYFNSIIELLKMSWLLVCHPKIVFAPSGHPYENFLGVPLHSSDIKEGQKKLWNIYGNATELTSTWAWPNTDKDNGFDLYRWVQQASGFMPIGCH